MAVFVNVPISVGGIGLREQLHYLLFAELGVPKEASVSLSLLVLRLFAGARPCGLRDLAAHEAGASRRCRREDAGRAATRAICRGWASSIRCGAPTCLSITMTCNTTSMAGGTGTASRRPDGPQWLTVPGAPSWPRAAADHGCGDRLAGAVGAEASRHAAAVLREGAVHVKHYLPELEELLMRPWDATRRSRPRRRRRCWRNGWGWRRRCYRSSQLGIAGEQSERLLALVPAFRRDAVLERRAPRATTLTWRCLPSTASRWRGRTTAIPSIRNNTGLSCHTCRRSICCSTAATRAARSWRVGTRNEDVSRDWRRRIHRQQLRAPPVSQVSRLPDPGARPADLRGQRRQPADGFPRRQQQRPDRVLVRRRPQRVAGRQPGAPRRRGRALRGRDARHAVDFRQPSLLRDRRARHAGHLQRGVARRKRRSVHSHLDLGGLRHGRRDADGRAAPADAAQSRTPPRRPAPIGWSIRTGPPISCRRRSCGRSTTTGRASTWRRRCRVSSPAACSTSRCACMATARRRATGSTCRTPARRSTAWRTATRPTVVGEVINIGTGESLSIAEVAQATVRQMGKPESLITYVGDRPGQVFRHTADAAKAKRLLGWEPSMDFESGLAQDHRLVPEPSRHLAEAAVDARHSDRHRGRGRKSCIERVRQLRVDRRRR